MKSDEDDALPKAKEPPIMEYLCNLKDRIDSKEPEVKVDRIHDLIVKPARKGDASTCSM